MKKKTVSSICLAIMMGTTSVVYAQYPQLTQEAKDAYTKMITEERRLSDEAWAKALPIVEKEAIFHGLRVLMICLKLKFRLSLVLKVAVCIASEVVAER
jgi:pantothenate kinase type III